ncbi:Ig-like V-type domain-containing protein FAM187A [Parambassis ranga]|uniref:Ig-like V-type domain-containing protein FAM187A n=1 Tax=Parambassis ranga TaxID=210632 RepID=A0A6P7IUW0_9TELE|nr:Ig-like V-type domain-containing protein FAM187A [Parambassis ranga]
MMFEPLSPHVWSYEAREDKQDVFASRACPAFLTFSNAAYLSGVTVELPCHCKPQQVRSVVWFFRKHQASSEETRALTDFHGNKLLDTKQVPHSGDLRSRFTIRLFSLLIFRAGPHDSGIYICGSASRDFFYGYDLDIQEAHTLSFTPRLPSEALREKRREDAGSSLPLYRVFTSFQPWSVCDRCDVPGEQVRVGLCYVHSRYLHVRYRRANQTVASCGSGAVPRAFNLQSQNKIGAKMDVRSCHVTCSPQPPPSSQMVALVAFLRSAYRHEDVPVFFLNHPAERVLTLGCPGARPTMAVAWDRESEPLYRSEHSAGGDVGAPPPRLQIDMGHHLVFNPAEIKDSGVYYCWLQGRRAAKIQLLVYANLGGQSVLSHPEFPVAVQTVLMWYGIMTAVFCLLLLGRAVVTHLMSAEEPHED